MRWEIMLFSISLDFTLITDNFFFYPPPPPNQRTLILAESKKETQDRMYNSFICPYKGCCFNYADMERKLSAIKMLTAMWIIQV